MREFGPDLAGTGIFIFLEEEEDPYVFGGDTTTKKQKTITGQKKIGDFFEKI